MSTKFLATIYCSLSGEPRVLITEVYGNQPVGVLDKEAYDVLRVAKGKTAVLYFKVEVSNIRGVIALLTCALLS
jgi:hypothetical protein